jgi:hypothetical protein
MGAARATMAAIDAISAPLMRAMEQSERELGVVAENQAAEQRVVDEADEARCADVNVVDDHCEICGEYDSECTCDDNPRAVYSVTVFDAKASVGLIAEIDAALREDGCATDIGVRRNATGYVTGIVVSYHRPEGGR